MRIKSGVPSIQMSAKQITFPWADKPMDLEFNVGKIDFEIEGDAKELVMHSTSIFTNIKDFVEHIRTVVHEEEDRTEEKRNYIQAEIDDAVHKVDSEYRQRIHVTDSRASELRFENSILKDDVKILQEQLSQLEDKYNLDVAAAFSRGLSNGEPLVAMKANYRTPPCAG